jgi:ribA/ribD-fused uncharacterized protein
MEQIVSFLEISKRDVKAEFECKLLSGKIQTKDVADRMIKAIQEITIGHPTEISLLRVMYPEEIRVEVEGAHNIQKICATNSFKGVPLVVQKKGMYRGVSARQDSVDMPDMYSKFTLRMEDKIRNDWDVSPTDPKTASIRLMNRRSYKTLDEFFQIDFSMVKSRKEKKQTLRDVLKEHHTYELEIEFIKRNTEVKSEEILASLMKIINKLLQSFQRSEFVLTPVAEQQYIREFKASSNVFVNPVTLVRKHLNEDKPYNILKGYTVTVKADGERCGLYVTRDRRLMRFASRTFMVAWTGMTALTDSFHGTFLDGEFIPEKNLFCIFDIYHYKGRSTTNLPLMTTDNDAVKNPLQSRLGCARQFVSEVQSHFTSEATNNMFKIETKTFLAGDGSSMENAIRELLDTKYEYQTDGLIFTPRASSVAPREDMDKNTWLRVYKWKPPHQNSIDFLLKLSKDTLFDPVLEQEVRKGELYISKSITDTVLYPCDTMTGEYVPRELPADLKERALSNPAYIPAPFQPSNPKDPEAYNILVPVDSKGLCFDEEKNRVEDDTIIECAYDVEKGRWAVMRTRYDKTYTYRVSQKPEYGNNRRVSDDIWSSIHIPVSEDMIRNCTQQTDEIKDYYIEDIDRKHRALEQSYKFHKTIKGMLYNKWTKEGDTLLELGSGIGGDKFRWSQARLSKVVGIEYNANNIKQACTRYIDDKKKNPEDYMPAILYVQGDFTQPLYQQESERFRILDGTEKGSTKYLQQFEELKKFDACSAQFVMHYACENEETFRIFVKNVTTHCNTFFGTCLDGKSVYTLLAGKQSHMFTNGKDVGGEYVKQYEDRESWTNEFGLAISVSMESIDSPNKEYLVPFDKVVDIFHEEGFELQESVLFSEIYASEKVTLSQQLQTFSFLNRTFVFKRGNKKEEVIEKVETAAPEVKEKKVRKLKKGGAENPVLFHGAGEDKGEFRNFSNMAEYPIQINDVKYPSVEHYFQIQKAKEFGDAEIEQKMTETPSTKAIKALGKKVKNFQKEVWDAKKQEIMMRGVRAKFVQHPELQKQLLETGDRQIGDADARDAFWGIGTSENTEKSKDPSKWKGQNKLGKLLMALRDDFR